MAACGATATTRSPRSASRSSRARSSGIRWRSPRRAPCSLRLKERGPRSAARPQPADDGVRRPTRTPTRESVRAPVRDHPLQLLVLRRLPARLPLCQPVLRADARQAACTSGRAAAGFLTTAHTDADLERVFAAFRDTLAEMQAADFLPGGEERRRSREPAGP